MDNIYRKTWITPFAKQLFVVFGTAINMGQLSFTIGFTARLLPQLRRPDSSIQVDDTTSSWIASTMGISLLIGNFVVPYIMGKFGRRPASILSSCLILIGWIWVSFATTATTLIIARTLQGLAVGIGGCVGPNVIGECSSPKNRGMFTSLTIFIFGVILVAIHTMGSYLSWQATAMITAGVTFGDVIIIVLSPETPSWLADKGKYEECRKIFHYLRGRDEDDELNKLIEASKSRRNAKLLQSIEPNENRIISKFASFLRTMKRREIYVPVIIGFNLYTLQQWCGLCILIGFIEDVFYSLVGPDIDFGLQIFLVDFIRLLTSLVGVIVIKRFRRRPLLAIIIGSNVGLLFVISAYSYAKVNGILSYDSPLIGIFLAHLLMISVTIGASAFVLTICSKIFPLEFRSLLGSLCKSIASVHFFIMAKTFAFSLQSLGFHGTFLMYGIVSGACLSIIMVFLPETKDKTLQEIEEELKGEKISEINQTNCPLTSATSEE